MVKPLLALSLLLFAQQSLALVCKISPGANGSRLFVGNDARSLRQPTMREVFDALNEKPALLNTIQNLKFAAISANGDAYWLSIDSIPTKGVGDPACGNKSITGYECRDRVLKREYGANTGIDYPVEVQSGRGQEQGLRELMPYLQCQDPSQPVVASSPHAAQECEVKAVSDGQCEISANRGSAWLSIRENGFSRMMRIEELFDKMNDNEDVLQILKGLNTRGRAGAELIKLEFDRTPKKGKNDPSRACPDKEVTGYACRDAILKEKFQLNSGIESDIMISTSPNKCQRLKSLMKAMKCDKPTENLATTSDSKPSKAPAAQVRKAIQ